ncbi:MAG: hypothetical protein ABUM51_08595, partial [Bacteroidota bacterium]
MPQQFVRIYPKSIAPILFFVAWSAAGMAQTTPPVKPGTPPAQPASSTKPNPSTAKPPVDPDDLTPPEKNNGATGAESKKWQWTSVDSAFGPLPSSVHVYRTEDSLEGRPSIAYYVSAPLK